jgi:hypothetical protein
MKDPELAERAAELRDSIARSQGDLDFALTELKRVSIGAASIGHWMAADPWNWLLIAGVAGAFMGLHRRNE